MAVLVERRNIGIFGAMNAGKSSIMNMLTLQRTSIVDATPGTTADTRVALCEIHGLGPVRLMDTAGLDEAGELGAKKLGRALNDLKECDLALLVIDPAGGAFGAEKAWLDSARELGRPVLVVHNLFQPDDRRLIADVERAVPALRFHRKIVLSAVRPEDRSLLLEAIADNLEPVSGPQAVLPFVVRDGFYVLIIPMDAETPAQRYLRPQAMCEESITRQWAYPVSFRLDLSSARGKTAAREREAERFAALLEGLGKKPRCLITDSQALDVMVDWCPPDVAMTTFSIAMINFMSGGRLDRFVSGLEALNRLQPRDKVLIAEACNHSRVGEDIGDVQIPRILRDRYPGLIIEHAYGREFKEADELSGYSLVIHCGACMITRQKMISRLRDLDALRIPYTNYGLLLARARGRAALAKVLEPWGGSYQAAA